VPLSGGQTIRAKPLNHPSPQLSAPEQRLDGAPDRLALELPRAEGSYKRDHLGQTLDYSSTQPRDLGNWPDSALDHPALDRLKTAAEDRARSSPGPSGQKPPGRLSVPSCTDLGGGPSTILYPF
jgi:hypothetical protein